MTSAFEASSASTSSSRRGRSSPCAIRRATGVSRTAKRLLDLGGERGNARPARGLLGAGESGVRFAGADAPHRNPGKRELMDGAQRRRQRREIDLLKRCARPRRGGRSGPGAGLRDSAHARRSPGRHAPRGVRRPRRAPSRARRGRARRARSPPRRRRICARATASLGPKARPARRTSAFARSRSPIWAMAMPRSASAGASSRSATRFSAPSGSPIASARAAAVISESIEIPSHLSLPGGARSILV